MIPYAHRKVLRYTVPAFLVGVSLSQTGSDLLLGVATPCIVLGGILSVVSVLTGISVMRIDAVDWIMSAGYDYFDAKVMAASLPLRELASYEMLSRRIAERKSTEALERMATRMLHAAGERDDHPL